MVSGVVYCLHSVLSNSLYFWSLLFFILSGVGVLYATAAAGEVLLLLLLVNYTLAGAILPLNVN
jgi:hypothetical protein